MDIEMMDVRVAETDVHTGVLNPFDEAGASDTSLPHSAAFQQPPLDDASRVAVQKVAEMKRARSADQVVVIRSTGSPGGKLISDMDNKGRCKVTAATPTDERGWEKVVRTAWPGIHARLMNDPLFDRSTFTKKKNAWRSIYNMMENSREKWVTKGGFINKVSEVPAGVRTSDTENVERLIWPVGTNRNYACILYTTRQKKRCKATGEEQPITSTAWILDISCSNVVTSDDTAQEHQWRPKYRPVLLLDANGLRQPEKKKKSKSKSPSYKKVTFTGIVKACLGIDNTALFVTTTRGGGGAAHLFDVRMHGMMHVLSIDIPSKVPTSAVCTKDMVVLGYSGTPDQKARGVYVFPRISEWKAHQVSQEPISSISASADESNNVILMCGIDEEAHPDLRRINLGPVASPEYIDRVRQEYDSGEGSVTCRASFWPTQQECMDIVSQSKGRVSGHIRGAPQNCYTCDEPTTNDALLVMSSADSVHIRRFSEATEQLRVTTTMPCIGTAIGLGVYNDILCVHTPENNVLIGNIYVGNLSLDINNAVIGANSHPATFHYTSIQMYHNRIVVLLATGQVSFFILQ